MTGIYTIPSGYPFLESLASSLRQATRHDPFSLSKWEIYLPTRRACLELKRAFLAHAKDTCVLLPKLRPLGDLETGEGALADISCKPVMPTFKRLSLLTNLIEDYTEKSGFSRTPTLSLKLARSLTQLMDQAAIEDVSWEGLQTLVASEFAQHWELTLDFLEIITSHWPKIIEESGYTEPYARHHEIVEEILKKWESTPPSHPILAAGSTGTMPATARLLQAIAGLPQGSVILPGLDSTLSEEEAESLSPCHPQYTLVNLLKKFEKRPADITLWPHLEPQESQAINRAELFSHAMKPKVTPPLEGQQDVLEDVRLVLSNSPQEEALSIAILMRQHLENPDQHIALITPDLKLIERVSWELKRWNIDIDSSFGIPLEQTPPGVFFRLSAELIGSPQDRVALLSLLKHPLMRLKRASQEVRDEIRRFEKALRTQTLTETSPFLQEVYVGLAPFKENGNLPFEALLDLHVKLAEHFSTDEKGDCLLWDGMKGKALKAFIAELKETATGFPDIALKDYPTFLKELFQGQRFNAPPQFHPRLSILSPLESRLFQSDVMILGGLNEGSWPADPQADPWLNRSMRAEMGFPPHERRVGLSAHDFAQAFASPKVYLTRSLKVDGTLTIACRWLERLEVYLKACGKTLPLERHIPQWAQRLDQGEPLEVTSAPHPTPPVSARPQKLSVTQIETWRRDPYAIYAKKILDLSPLDPLKARLQASDRGSLIHQALDAFFKLCPDPSHKDALNILLFIGNTLFEPYKEDPSFLLFWWPRFCQLATWFIEWERETRMPNTKTYTEVSGQLTFMTDRGPFKCTAKADRIDLLPDGRLRILDYKTGTPPSDEDVRLGFSPQLPLEGAIALAQGFEGISATEIESFQYWWLKGDKRGGVVRTLSGDPNALAFEALEGLKALVEKYEDEETPYPAHPLPKKGLKYNDYAHLARIQEWSRW